MKILAFIFFSVAPLLLPTSIYEYSVSSIDGGEIRFNDFRGKKILLVNIATGSIHAGQLAELEFLHQQYSDSLVVIGFPSGSFGNEVRSNAQVKEFCRYQYGVSFLLAASGDVKGSNIQPVYQWLTRKMRNGQLETAVEDDFQKYILDSNGELIGVFRGSVSPVSDQIKSIVTSSSN